MDFRGGHQRHTFHRRCDTHRLQPRFDARGRNFEQILIAQAQLELLQERCQGYRRVGPLPICLAAGLISQFGKIVLTPADAPVTVTQMAGFGEVNGIDRYSRALRVRDRLHQIWILRIGRRPWVDAARNQEYFAARAGGGPLLDEVGDPHIRAGGYAWVSEWNAQLHRGRRTISRYRRGNLRRPIPQVSEANLCWSRL